MIRWTLGFVGSFALWVVLASDSSAQDPRFDVVERMMFQGVGGVDEAKAFAELEKQLEAEILRIDQSTGLNDQQKQRLRLAGKGDIERLVVRVDKVKQRIQTIKDSGKNDNETLQLAVNAASEIQLEFRTGIFGERSLLMKVARSSLSAEHLKLMEKEVNDRQRLETDKAIDLWMVGFTRATGLDREQQKFIEDWMKEHVKPFDGTNPLKTIVMEYFLSTIPDRELKKHLSDDQIKTIQQRVGQVQVDRLIPILRQHGLID